jgi:flagellar hook-basal body complex protein FliE
MSIGAIDTGRIEAMVAQLRAAGARATPPGEGAQALGKIGGESGQGGKVTGAGDFSSVLKTSLEQVNQSLGQSQQLGERFASGDSSVSLSDAMISMQKAGIALQQTVQVRNKLVAAYQEIMNMNV